MIACRMSHDPYLTLELQSNASDAEVKAAYRRLAALYHPDRNPGFQAAATERLKALNAAYAAITTSRRQTSTSPGESPQQGRRDDDDRDATQGPGARNAHQTYSPHEDPPSSPPPKYVSIAAALTRVGFLSRDASAEDNVVVQVLSATLPPGANIIVCVSYIDVRSTFVYPHSEHEASYRRPLLMNFGATLGPQGLSSFVKPPPTQVVLCTDASLVWTRSRFANADGATVEELVTVHSIPVDELLGAVARKKGRVEILVDEGPTLTFRTRPEAAAELSLAIDAAAASA